MSFAARLQDSKLKLQAATAAELYSERKNEKENG